jgi:hypothetical protein
MVFALETELPCDRIVLEDIDASDCDDDEDARGHERDLRVSDVDTMRVRLFDSDRDNFFDDAAPVVTLALALALAVHGRGFRRISLSL